MEEILLIFAFFGGVLVGIILISVFNRIVKRTALSLTRASAGEKGRENQKNQAERLMSFMTDVKINFDRAKAEGKDVKQFAVEDLPGIALQYPDVVLKFGKRLKDLLDNDGFGGIGDIEQLLNP